MTTSPRTIAIPRVTIHPEGPRLVREVNPGIMRARKLLGVLVDPDVLGAEKLPGVLVVFLRKHEASLQSYPGVEVSAKNVHSKAYQRYEQAKHHHGALNSRVVSEVDSVHHVFSQSRPRKCSFCKDSAS